MTAIAIDRQDWRKIIAEVVGTFFFFFIGIGSIQAAGTGSTSTLYVALAHGVALAIAISALGHISGGHFNPAVTIGLAVGRKITPLLGLLYIIAQIVGGVLASAALVAVLPANSWQAYHLGTPSLAPTINAVQGTALEAILTFFLVLAVYGTAVDPRANRIAGFGIGLTVFVDVLVGGPLTGGAMNPARAIAPAIVSGTWTTDQLVYWIGPILGGIIAGLVYMLIFMPGAEKPPRPAPPITERPVEPPASEPDLVR